MPYWMHFWRAYLAHTNQGKLFKNLCFPYIHAFTIWHWIFEELTLLKITKEQQRVKWMPEQKVATRPKCDNDFKAFSLTCRNFILTFWSGISFIFSQVGRKDNFLKLSIFLTSSRQFSFRWIPLLSFEVQIITQSIVMSNILKS